MTHAKDHLETPVSTADDKQRILAARAARLARPRDSGEQGATLPVVQFTIGCEQYAIEPMYVREVFRFRDLTRVPGVPPFVLGIINVRGRVVSLLDLRVFFDLPRQGLHDRSRAVILFWNEMEIGILIDAIDRAREVPVSSIEPALPALTGIRARYLKGITADRVVILDGRKLLTDKTLVCS